jgi:ERCC4-related helicase
MGNYTPFHSQYLAHRITLEGVGDEAFTKSLSTARVDMNPHQVDAAVFALKSPLSKGVILGDEVGLGKTIEACLVIAQKWAERKRRVILIVPASLRKQWAQELREKFSLDSVILDAKTYKERLKAGVRRPFEAENAVVIVSYEFASGKADEVAVTDWDLVIYDEAHRLRNVYRKNGSKRAKLLKEALQHPFKMLLTATPLQNSLMELFGLASMIDDHHFGDQYSFRTMYTGAGSSPATLSILKNRRALVCQRTLRRQVVEAGHINFTKRMARTFDFEPGNEEVLLYEKVSNFLRRKDTIAFGDRTNHLVILVARKILGSSTFAISQFLQGIINRLEEKKRIDETVLDDVDTVEELAEELDDEEETPKIEPPIDPALLKAEIVELESYRDLALSIGANAKGEKLVEKLPEILAEILKRGGQEKAVIFTESVRTQKYLAEVLTANGFDGRIVLMNGSNNDDESKAVYADWLARHQGTDAVSGSKSADMKAAIVEAFKSDNKNILISTESGAEGINLQFCSLVVNFDLPWNPQRIEQRIGRCHRYGQKLDVTVVNLLNRKNKAEARVYELLEKKFKLFEGVFGASDEVLGTIERGIDFERKVLQIVQEARSDEQVQLSFDLLQKEMDERIDADMLDARRKLMEHMDQDVVRRLKTRKGMIEGSLNEFSRRLITIVRAELPDAHFHGDQSPRFDYQDRTYTTEWPLADEKGWQFFRLADGNLAQLLVDQAKERQLDARCIRFDHSTYPGLLADVRDLAGKKGWLKLSKLSLKTPQTVREHIVAACVTDQGDEVHPETVDRLFVTPATDEGAPKIPSPDDQLLSVEVSRQQAIIDEAQQQNAQWLDAETDKLDAYADDLEKAAEVEIKDMDDEIKAARKALRISTAMAMVDKLKEKRRIQRLEETRDEMKLKTFERRKSIRDEVNQMLDDIAQSMETAPVLEPLFSLRWEVVA